MQRFDSVREKDFNLNFCTTKKGNYIQSIESDCRNKGESHFICTLLFGCLIGPFVQEDSVWNFGPIEVKIYMEHSDGFHASSTFLVLQQQQNLGWRLSTSKVHLRPPVTKAAVCSKAVVLLLLTFCLLLLPLCKSVIVLCYVVRYFMSILGLQSS